MEGCCVCFGEYMTPVIINSGITICDNCVRTYCPLTRIEITTKILNIFAIKFFQYTPPLAPSFTLNKLMKSSDKIAYIIEFDEIELDDPKNLIDANGKFILNVTEFKIFASKCINLLYANDYGKNLLHYACDANELGIVKYLVEKEGANVNCVSNNHWHPMHYICRKGDEALEVVKYLISHGADVNCTDIHDQRPIYFASIKGSESFKLIKYLVENGADVNCSNNYGNRPMHYVCWGGDKSLDIVKYLVSCGADVNCVNSGGWRPIHNVCYKCNDIKSLELINYLLANGADPNVRTNDGKLPSDFTKNEEILRLLVKN
jgi:ankyrin repeat protein